MECVQGTTRTLCCGIATNAAQNRRSYSNDWAKPIGRDRRKKKRKIACIDFFMRKKKNAALQKFI